MSATVLQKRKLKELREKKKLSIVSLAAKADVSESLIEMIEAGRPDGSKTNRESARLIVKALKLSGQSVEIDDIDWPNGLTDVGRPPSTGRPTTRTGPINIAHCPSCNVQIPAGTSCVMC